MSKTHFEQYVNYKSPNLERNELCDEKLKNVFSSLKSHKRSGHEISSLGVLKHVLNLSINQDVFPET